MTTKKQKTLVERHIEALKQLKGMSAEAGWFETARYKGGKKPNGQDIPSKQVGMAIARIMRIQEFGATIKRSGKKGNYTIVIPARPAMRLAAKNFEQSRESIQHVVASKLIRGAITPEQGLGQIALFLEGCIVDSIKNGGWAPNAARTVAKKGFDKPLIDTAQAWQSVASKVNK